MQTVNVICIGKLKEKYFTEAVKEYSKRLSAFCKFNIIELDEEKLPDNPSQSQIDNTLKAEGARIIKKLTRGSMVIAMCIEGKMLSSEELSRTLDKASFDFSTLDFIIGGSWGLSDEVKRLSHLKLSMSKMTFPHQLARVLLCEQIYRGYQIMNNGKYHK